MTQMKSNGRNFKVGDIVAVTNTEGTNLKKGDIGIIKQIKTSNFLYPLFVYFSTHYEVFNGSELALVKLYPNTKLFQKLYPNAEIENNFIKVIHV